VPDVLGEGLPGLAVEDDDPCHSLQADEQVVLTAFLDVEAADTHVARASEVRLHHPAWERAVATELAEPAPLVLEPPQWEAQDALDAHPFAPVSSTIRPISERCLQR